MVVVEVAWEKIGGGSGVDVVGWNETVGGYGAIVIGIVVCVGEEGGDFWFT